MDDEALRRLECAILGKSPGPGRLKKKSGKKGTEITLLHMSEIHFRHKKREENNTFRHVVQARLIETVKTHSEIHNPPDVVAVTGDIAFSGKKDEYDEAMVFFEKLSEVLPGETEFLPVPGNHDVDRERVTKLFSLHRIVRYNEVDSFLENKKYVRDFVNGKFKSFRGFAGKLNSLLYKNAADYFWVRNSRKKNVSFLGFNSAWASEGDDDQTNIALGFPQVQQALAKTKAIPNRIVLMHHPPVNWLKDIESGSTRTELFGNCQLLLHGHNHADQALAYRDPDYSCICLGANASYTNNKEGFIGFQFIHVKFSDTGKKGPKVTVWPYKWEERRSEFAAHYGRWRSQEGKPFFIMEAVAAAKKKKPGDIVSLEIPADYREWLREFHSVLPMDHLARKGEAVVIDLPAVYIALETANPFHKPEDEREMKQGKGKKSKEPALIDIEELLGRVNCLLLRGKAGMGKTTLVRHLAYGITHGSGPAALAGCLPILIFLKDLWPVYRDKLQENPEAVTFESLLRDYFEEEKYRAKHRCPLTKKTIEGFMTHNRALFLLDGLDEVPEEIRGDLVELVHRFQFAHSENRFLLTGRAHGIEDKGLLCFGKHLRDIEPLGSDKSSEFIRRWYRAVSGQAKGMGEVTAADLIEDIKQHEHAWIFTGNPLLLTALCVFYLVGGKRMPDQRSDLYDRIVGNLLYRRFHDPADPEKVNRVREYLMLLAFTMHSRTSKTIEAYDAVEILKANHPKKEAESDYDYKKRIEFLFASIEPLCGLLSRQGSGEIEFYHLSFQEFLAASFMLDRGEDYKKYLADSWWQEVLLLYMGLMNLGMKKPSNDIVVDLLKNYAQPRIQLVGAEALRDFPSSKREEASVTLARNKLLAIMESAAVLRERFAAGEILGTLGDPRLNVLNPPMIEIPAGEFIRGSDDKDSNDREKPVRRIYLDSFEMGKYPVTNHEFKSFIENKGYDHKEFWTPEGWDWREKKTIFEPEYWQNRKWHGSNFPVVGVSWYEAWAYAAWLGRETCLRYVLPSEAQWEKASRGSEGYLYPWGGEWQDDRCNSAESGLERTSPVGIFPSGASPYGCQDICGNVWEWCADWFEKDYYKKSPERNPMGPAAGSGRVIRGGSWFIHHGSCRTYCRFRGHPGGRGFDGGFRLARLF